MGLLMVRMIVEEGLSMVEVKLLEFLVV